MTEHDRVEEPAARQPARTPTHGEPAHDAGPGAGNAAVARMRGGQAAMVARAVHSGALGMGANGAVARMFDGAVQRSEAGRELPEPFRAEAEGKFGTDFSGVRLHTDAAADDAAGAIDARAFTVGSDIYFAGGQYQPGNTGGRRLLAHELTHVVQNSGAPQGYDSWISEPDDPAELAAEAAADRFVRSSGPSLSDTAALSGVLGVVHREGEPAPDDAGAKKAADDVWDALGWWDDEDKVLATLGNKNAGTRTLMKQKFREAHNREMADYIKEHMRAQNLVKAIALLEIGHTHDPHVQMALALFGAGTRDAELWRVLDSLPLAGRKEMEKRYDEVFGKLGSGSLKKDLDDDLDGWAEQKSIAMLDRDLTPADALYFDSVGITGTHVDSVVGHIQAAWAGGLERMKALEGDWKKHVIDKEHWTALSLKDAMKDELSGEPLELVQAVFTQYEKLGGAQGGQVPPAALEDARLAVAQASLDAATTGGYTGAGTNNDQVFKAVTEIRTVWQERIKRVAGTPEEATFKAQWDKERARLLAFLPSEMDTGTAEYKRARLLLSGNLTPVDEIWLAIDAGDYDKVVELITRYWTAGKMSELLTQANIERKDESGNVLRPAVNLGLAVPTTSGMPHRRILALTEGGEEPAKGAARLKLELDDDNSDAALRNGYSLLKDASSALRDGTIKAFADANLGAAQGATPVRKFLGYIQTRYDSSYTCYDFMDMLDPAASAQARAERAEGRMNAGTKWYDPLLGGVTGEQQVDAAQESLERLKFIAAHSGANDHELDAMAAMLGKPKSELAALEYDAFKTRLDELRSLRQSIVDALATAVELVVSVAITVATGGAAGGLLLASLASAVAGMLLKEALLDKDYEFTSDENLQRLAVEIAAGSLGAFGGALSQSIGASAQLAELGRTQFMRAALQEAFTGLGRTIGEGAFSNKMPTTEDIVARAISIAGASAGAGAGKVLGKGAAELPTTAQQLRRNVGAAMANQMITGMTDEASSVVRTGVGNNTGPELAGKFAKRGAQAMLSGLVSGAGDTISHRKMTQAGAKIDELPDASIISGGDRPFSVQEADAVYQNCRKDSPHREAAILESATGERIVIQGHAHGGFGEKGAFEKTWREFAAGRTDGPWRHILHSHAVDAATGVTPAFRRVPSGRGGDLSIVEAEAKAANKPVEHVFDIITESGPQTIRYGYDPTADHPFWTEVLDGKGGKQRMPFKSFEDYNAWYEKQFGRSPEVEDGGGPAAPGGYERKDVLPPRRAWDRLKQVIWDIDKDICQFCQRTVNRDVRRNNQRDDDATVDHAVPRTDAQVLADMGLIKDAAEARRELNSQDNLFTCCAACNRTKQDRWPGNPSHSSMAEWEPPKPAPRLISYMIKLGTWPK